MIATEHLLHGLRVRSEVPLPEPERPIDVVDLHISWGEPRVVPSDVPPGVVVAEMVVEGHRLYTAIIHDQQYLLRFHGTCDVSISGALDAAVCHVHPDVDPAIVSVLVSGTVLALIVELAGDLVLHASAVDIGGRAVAIVGTSGMGKSTVAAMLCHGGASLVSDDIVRVQGGLPPQCHRGASALRIRPTAASIVDLHERPHVVETPDRRLGLYLRQTDLEVLPMAMLVIPRPSRDISAVIVERMAPAEALLALGRFPRVYGMRRSLDLKRQFAQRAQLVDAVPVLVADIPWGPPFHPEIGAALLDALDVHLASQSSASE